MKRTDRRGTSWPSSWKAAAFAALCLLGLVLLAGVPRGPEAPTQATGGGSSPGGPPPLSGAPLVTNNTKLGYPFGMTVHTRPGVAVWFLVSSAGPPTTIAGMPVDLAADWFILQDLTWTQSGGTAGMNMNVPWLPGLEGSRFVVQAALYDPVAVAFGWTESVEHEVVSPLPHPFHVLLVRQTVPTAGAPSAVSQADWLASALTGLGLHVTVVDNGLPADLAPYDCILDCRFDIPPGEWEKAVFARFLRTNGGIFLLCGPSTGSIWGQQRLAWVQTFLQGTLGIATWIGPGGVSANGTLEQVHPGTDPAYLTAGPPVSGQPYAVRDEGGTFGALGGSGGAGTPWITTSTWPSTVYGKFFQPSDVQAFPATGRVAVLFNGGGDALLPSPENPAPELVFLSLVAYLDA